MRVRDARWMVLGVLAMTAATSAQTPGGGQPAGQPPRPALTLTTTAFPDGDPIPAKYTQAGEQVSPALTWTNVPPGTVSFVLHMRDPDVARNKTTEDQVHWLVWNIPGTATGLPEGVAEGAGARRTAASRSARAVPCIAVRALPRRARCTTTRSSSTRSTPRWTSRPARTRGRRGRRSGKPCRATSSARPFTSACSVGHSRPRAFARGRAASLAGSPASRGRPRASRVGPGVQQCG